MTIRTIPIVTKTASFDTRRPITSRMMPRIIMQRIYPATAKQTWTTLNARRHPPGGQLEPMIGRVDRVSFR